MRLRTATVATILTSITAVASNAPADPGSAGTNDQAGGSAASSAPAGSPTTSGDTTSSALTAPEPTVQEVPVEYGIDIRARSIFVPKAELQLFLNRAAGSVQDYGIGADFVRRRGNNELQIGVEFENVQPAEGVYINKGDTVPVNSVDYILSPAESGANFGWFTIDFTFFHHAPINKYVSFRYGAGAGIGIINGALDHYNVRCAAGATNANPEPACTPQILGGQAQITDPNGNIISTNTQYKYSIPPVFPVIDAIVGFQFHPIDKMLVDLELGLHTLPYIGANIGYMFN
jgi:hypothetical protein